MGAPTGFGVEGGLDGAGGEMTLFRLVDGEPDETEAYVAPKYGLAEFPPVRLVARSPGGGGWGDPANRSRELVRRDVRDGVVSPEAARDIYGLDD